MIWHIESWFRRLYELELENRLPGDFYIVGFARRDWNDDAMREHLRQGVQEFARTQPIQDWALEKLLNCMHYLQSNFDDADGYRKLGKMLDDLHIANRSFLSGHATRMLIPLLLNRSANAQLANCPDGWTRIVVEKPFGFDLYSAWALDDVLHNVFEEHQIYRIDHYLGKETVQNILVFRFANGIFEQLWNRRNINHVQITVAETVGVGNRAGYYESAGVIRDVFQNHILQLLTLTAMEAPVAFHADAVRDEKVKILRSLRPLRRIDTLTQTFRAQYVSGTVDGKRVPGYKDEQGVASDSANRDLSGSYAFMWIIGVGLASHFTSAQVNDCHAGLPRSPSTSGRYLYRSSDGETWLEMHPTYLH